MSAHENEFPENREANRAHLLAAVDSVADALTTGRDESEKLRRLSPSSVEALRSSGLFKMKSPREVGGAEAHPVTQMDVIEAVTMIDPAAAWCTDEATDLVSELFRFTGGSAVMNDSEMQRILRDIYTVQSHLMVSAVVYEQYGQIMLGMTEGGALP